MLITYLRSSSIGAYRMCPHSYFLNYVLGIKSPSGKAAAKGNVVHKAMETLAWQSYHASRNNKTYDDETFGKLIVSDITPEWAIDESYLYYKGLESHLDWKDKFDLKDCHNWMRMALISCGGLYDPRKLNVISPEVFFEMDIEEDWAKYSYDLPTGPIEGYLGLKGTMDLVVQDAHDENVLEIIDWKTGARKDWATGEEKDFTKLMKDPQLLLYLYAASRLYPGKTLSFTIVFIKDGGPYRMMFGPEHIEKAKDMIRDYFLEIKNDDRPNLNKSWRCEKFCAYSKIMSDRNPTQSVCDFYRDEIYQIGANEAFYKGGDISALVSYGCGGGRQAKGE